MDNLLEILVPLIFAAIYFFGNMFSQKSEEEGPPKPPVRPASPEEAEAAERKRRIQEEIRRKIMERRGQAAESAPVVTPPRSEKLQERRRAIEAQREVRDRHKEIREVVHESETPPHLAPTHEVEAPVSDGRFSWDVSDNIYEKNMQAQLQRIEETKRQAERLKREASQWDENTEHAMPRRSSKSGGLNLSGSVRDNLRKPSAARAAFIYGEVLGQPISMRKQSSVPGLSQNH
jgi:hypothetical protein